MVYNNLMKVCFSIAFIMLIISNVVFATTSVGTIGDDQIYTTVMRVLLRIQKYSWPVAILVLIYALYQYYVIGSEAFEHKVAGQRLVMGISIFMAIIQCLPLLYAFVIVR